MSSPTLPIRDTETDSQRPWLSRYPPDVPHTIEAPEQSLGAPLFAAAAESPDRPFLDFFGKRTTYSEAARLVSRAAAGLQRLGVGRDTRVGLCLPNTPYSVLCFFAVLAAGGTVVNFNPLSAEQQILRQIDDSGIQVAFTIDLQPVFGRILGGLGGARLRHVVVCRMANALPFPRDIAFRFREHAHLEMPSPDERVLDFATLITGDGTFDPASAPARSDVAVIQYTGGTTGEPKGVLLSHKNLLANVAQLRAWFTRAEPGAERFLAVLPFFHAFGMTAVMNFAVALGGELVILPRFRPAEALRAIRRRRITMLVGVPALYHALAECPAITRTDLTSLKVCVSGGDILPESEARRFVTLAGVPLAEGYGLTECGPVVACGNPLEGIERPGSCGLPLPGTDLAIMSVEEPRVRLPAGEVGEICVRGPQVMLGYWRRPEATRDALGDGWLHTGDLGRLDRDGFLYFVSRRPEVIAVRGYKVYARVVEDAIRPHPAVADVAVVGMPDPARGEVPIAFIVLREDMTLAPEALRAFLSARLSPIEMPRSFEFRADLPRSAFGKVLKHELVGSPARPPSSHPGSETKG